MRSVIGFVFLLTLLSGCSQPANADDEENYILGAALTKLSKFIEASALSGRFGESTATEDILAHIEERDSTLLDPFKEHLILIAISQSHVVVLVCLPDKSASVLEDAGCTPHLDEHRWQAKSFSECSFTIEVAAVCEN